MSRKEEANFIPTHCSFGGTEKSGSLADLSSVLVTAANLAAGEQRREHRAGSAEGREHRAGSAGSAGNAANAAMERAQGWECCNGEGRGLGVLPVLGVRSEGRQEAAGVREQRARPECLAGAILGPPAPAPSTAGRSCLSHLLHPLSPSLSPSCSNLLRPRSKLEELFFHSALLTLDLFSDWQPRCFPGMVGKERSFLHFN